MADKRIKGITIEIGSDTVGLNKALSDVNKKSTALQNELKDVERLLKFNPGNVEAVAQKQRLLADQVAATTDKLNRLKEAEQQVQAQFESGKISEEQYRSFRREVEFTQGSLDKLKTNLSNLEMEQEKNKESTKQLATLLKATNTTLEDYADTVGNRLTNSIKKGTVTGKQLEEAIQKIGQQALGTNVDIDKMKKALSSVDDGASLKSVKKELSSLATEAKEAQESVNDLGGAVEGVAGALVAGGGLAGAIETALDSSSLNTKIDVSFDVPEASIAVIRDAVKNIESYGIDGEAALEGVRRQWALNKDASDEANSAIVQGAAIIASSYAGIDFTELIQETNEIANELKVSQEEALALTNHLLSIGFPPEQLDIIAEYGAQLKRAGYDGNEIKALFEAGINTGTWNIDNLLDGLKEGRIRVAEFGEGIPKALKPLLKDAQISEKQLLSWGQAVAKGGEGGTKAMTAIANALNGVKDETLKNALGVQVFGTMYEDQGKNILNTLLNAKDATTSLKENQEQLNQATSKLNADPAIKMKKAIADMKTELQPLLTNIAEFIAKIAEWISNNPKLAATITAIVTVIGVLVGVCMALAPVFFTISSAMAAFGLSLGALFGWIGVIVAAIAGLIAVGVLVYKNWDEIKAKAVEVWGSIKEWFSTTLDSIKQTFSNIWTAIKTSTSETWNKIKEVTSQVWEGIKQTALNVWKMISSGVMAIITPFINGALNIFNNMKSGLAKIFDGIKQYFSGVWSLIKNIFLGAILLITDLVTGDFEGLKNDTKAIFENIKTALHNIWEGIKKIFSGAVSALKGYVKGAWENLKSVTSSVFNAMKSTISAGWSGIKSIFNSTVNSIKSYVSNGFENIRNAISDKMQAAKNKIVEVWNSAKKFLLNVDLAQIGKDIIQGLINGLSSKIGEIQKKASEIANSVKNTIKKALDIHSPSRETHKLGEHTGQGFANGIEAKKAAAEQAAKKAATAAKKAYEEQMDKAEYKFKMGKINSSEYISELRKIRDEYAKTPAQVREVNLEIKKIQDSHAKELKRIKEQEFKDALKSIKDKAAAGKLSTDQEYAQLKALSEKYKKNSKERLEIEKEMHKVKLKLAKEQEDKLQKQFDKEKALVEKKKYYNQLSLTDELALYESYVKKYKKGSEQREYYEREVYRVKKEINAKLIEINEEYADKVSESNKRLIEEEKRLNDEYKKAVDDRAKSLVNFTGIFDEVAEKSDVSGQKLLDNLKSQVDTFRKWSNNISNLAAKGIDQGLLAELREMGPSAAAEIAALNTLSSTELQDYVMLWKQKNALARTEAEKQLEGMKVDTQTKINELRVQTQQDLELFKTQWLAKITEIRTGTTNELDMKASLKDIGINSVSGLMEGISEMTEPLMQQAKELAEAVSSTIRQALNVGSSGQMSSWSPVKIGESIKNGVGGIIEAAKKSVSSATASGKASTSQSTTYSYGNISVSIPASDIKQMNDVVDFFGRLPQVIKQR